MDGEKRDIRVEETDLEDGRRLKIQCPYRRRNGQDQVNGRLIIS